MKSQLYLLNCTNWATPSGSSRGPIETPRKFTLPALSSYSFCISGISARHGGHHVPQKLSSSGLPRIDSRVMVLPVLLSTHWKLGGSAPILGASARPLGLLL